MDNLPYLIRVAAVLWTGFVLLLLALGHTDSQNVENKSSYFIFATMSAFLPSIQYLTGDYETNLIGKYDFGSPYLTYAGFVLIIVGVLVHLTGVITLGKQWSIYVRVESDTHIVQNGIYSFIRHPIYSGLILAITGFSITVSNWIAFFFIFLPNLMSIGYRTLIEEKALLNSFGDEYRQYMKRTKRYVPFLL